MPSLFDVITRVSQSLWPRTPSRHGRLGGVFLPGSRLDYSREAGSLWLNSVVSLGIAWLSDRFPKPILRVSRIARDGTYVPLPRHPLVDLWTRPNDFYFRHSLESAIGLSLVCDGNGYVLKVRDGAGRLKELWWQPHTLVEPGWAPDGSTFIDHYLITVDGRQYRVAASEVIKFQRGLDPDNPRKGISPLKACLREVGVINHEATFTLGLLRNSAVPGVAIIPDDTNLDVTKEVAEGIKERMHETFGRDATGGTIVFTGKYDVKPIGFTPEQLRLDRLPMSAVARVAAAVGPSAMSLGLPDPNKTYSNLAEANRVSWSVVMGMQDRIAEALRWQCLPEFGTDPFTHIVEYDYTSITELNEATDTLHARVRDDWQAGLYTLNEARDLIGSAPIDGGDRFFPGTDASESDELDLTLPAPERPTEAPASEPEANGKALAWRY